MNRAIDLGSGCWLLITRLKGRKHVFAPLGIYSKDMLDFFIGILEALALLFNPVRFGKWMHEALYGKEAQSERGDSFFGIVGVTVITATLLVLAMIVFWAIS